MDNDLAAKMRPVAEPRVLERVYSDDQIERLFGIVRDKGPWRLILAQHFKNAEEVMATLSGSFPKDAVLEDFLTPTFRGFFAEEGICYYPEIEDIFYNREALDAVRSYWNVDIAQPTMMMFNVQGPMETTDPAHIDSQSFRGVARESAPAWLMGTMAKSSLFERWAKKTAQVISWYYRGSIGGGFTYWPQGALEPPKRLAMPMWNKGVVVQNERMFHRGESNGPVDLRKPAGLKLDSLFSADPDDPTGYQIVTGDEVIQRIPGDEVRLLVHWNADLYSDIAEARLVLDRRDDLSLDQVADIFLKDLRARGRQIATPSDPFNDPEFIRQLREVYDLGSPRIYPPEAPAPRAMAA